MKITSNFNANIVYYGKMMVMIYNKCDENDELKEFKRSCGKESVSSENLCKHLAIGAMKPMCKCPLCA